MLVDTAEDRAIVNQHVHQENLDYLWLELTNKCDLECVHCYADSGPKPSMPDLLDLEKYKSLISEAADCGCRNVQFLGGEPTLFKDLPLLLDYASEVGYLSISIVTNATHISEDLLHALVRNKVRVAYSIYSDRSEVHDAITGRKGSHHRTVENVRRMFSAGIEIRGSVVAMDMNRDQLSSTETFIKSLGITTVRSDDLREFGRGAKEKCCSDIQQLCGSCWKGILCVLPDGSVSPCSMSRSWTVGSVLSQTLQEILRGAPLIEMRELIKSQVWEPRMADYLSLTTNDGGNQPQEDDKKNPHPSKPSSPPDTKPEKSSEDPPIRPLCGPICQPYNHCLPD